MPNMNATPSSECFSLYTFLYSWNPLHPLEPQLMDHMRILYMSIESFKPPTKKAKNLDIRCMRIEGFTYRSEVSYNCIVYNVIDLTGSYTFVIESFIKIHLLRKGFMNSSSLLTRDICNGFGSNSDLYGLGIRIGIYLQ